MKLHHSLCVLAALATLPAAAQDEPSARTTAAIDLVVNGQIRRVVIELNDEVAPQTCDNFVKMARSGYYNGLAVHRAIQNYLVQMGDPYTRDEAQKHLWGTGGPDHSVPAEIKSRHVRGSVAMARMPSGNASSGSQFFITLDTQSQLDGKYAVFANVIRGIEHLDYIGGMTVDTNDVPITRVEINAVTVAVPGEAPAANSNAVLANAAGAASVAGGAVKNAGQRVVQAVPDKMPKAKLPKLSAPRLNPFGRREAVPPTPAADENVPEPAPAPAPAPAPPVDDRVPPEIDMLEDEVAAIESGAPPAAADEADVPQITEDPNTKRKLLTLPVPKRNNNKSGETGVVGRVIKRVW